MKDFVKGRGHTSYSKCHHAVCKVSRRKFLKITIGANFDLTASSAINATK